MSCHVISSHLELAGTGHVGRWVGGAPQAAVERAADVATRGRRELDEALLLQHVLGGESNDVALSLGVPLQMKGGTGERGRREGDWRELSAAGMQQLQRRTGSMKRS